MKFKGFYILQKITRNKILAFQWGLLEGLPLELSDRMMKPKTFAVIPDSGFVSSVLVTNRNKLRVENRNTIYGPPIPVSK